MAIVEWLSMKKYVLLLLLSDGVGMTSTSFWEECKIMRANFRIDCCPGLIRTDLHYYKYNGVTCFLLTLITKRFEPHLLL